MKTRLAVALAVVTGLTLAARAEEKGRGDAAKLLGRWHIVGAQVDGKPVPRENIQDTTVVIEKGQLYIEDGKHNKTWVVTYKLDPSKKPRAITMTVREGRGYKGQTAPGIYDLEGDQLKLCYALPPHARPESFAAKKGSGDNFFLLKRGDPKPAKKR